MNAIHEKKNNNVVNAIFESNEKRQKIKSVVNESVVRVLKIKITLMRSVF